MDENQIKKIILIMAAVFVLPALMGRKLAPFLILAAITALIVAIAKGRIKLDGLDLGVLKSKSAVIDKIKIKHNGKNMAEKIINVKNMGNFSGFKKKFLAIAGAVFLVWLFFASIVIIDAGETGVYSLFGRVKDKELSSGFHLVIPLAKVTKMSIRTEEYTMSIATAEGKKIGDDSIRSLTKEGLSVDLDITVLYRLKEENASDVYKNVGLFYEEKVIRPSIRSVIREIIARYEAKDIYSEKREEAAKAIVENLEGIMAERGIFVEDVLLRNIQLPANLAQSIQEKLQAEQEAEKYDFILEREKKEKERKIIEAEGQKEAQDIISRSLTQNYLNYLYIKELKEREGTVYVPVNPDNGMPLFRDIGR